MKSILMLLVFSPVFLFSQNNDFNDLNPRRNSVYLEFLGNSPTSFSLNYERILTDSHNEYASKLRKDHVALRLGFGYFPVNDNWKDFAIPFELLLVFGSKRHHFEMGLGATSHFEVTTSQDYNGEMEVQTDFSVILFSRLGYRYTGPKGFMFRLGYTPMIYEFFDVHVIDHPFQLWGGVSMGYSF